jgi:hypothetical protein
VIRTAKPALAPVRNAPVTQGFTTKGGSLKGSVIANYDKEQGGGIEPFSEVSTYGTL